MAPPPVSYFLSPHEITRIKEAADKYFAGVFEQVDAAAAITAANARDGDGADIADIGGPGVPDFVWVHRASRATKRLRERARVCSQLAGIRCLEDKASLAVLTRDLRVPTLRSFVVNGGAAGFRRWCARHLPPPGNGAAARGAPPPWIVKEAGANGGEGIWVFGPRNAAAVASAMAADRPDGTATYVVQRYVANPALWDGTHKFHLRVYALLTGDMRFYVYRKAFAHVVNRPFVGARAAKAGAKADGGGCGDCDCFGADNRGGDGGGDAADAAADAFEREAHITNVSQNIHDDASFHGLVPVDLPLDFAAAWPRVKALFADLARAARPFMARQLSADHFHHLGADVILDAAGTPWLIEPAEIFCGINTFFRSNALHLHAATARVLIPR